MRNMNKSNTRDEKITENKTLTEPSRAAPTGKKCKIIFKNHDQRLLLGKKKVSRKE